MGDREGAGIGNDGRLWPVLKQRAGADGFCSPAEGGRIGGSDGVGRPCIVVAGVVVAEEGGSEQGSRLHHVWTMLASHPHGHARHRPLATLSLLLLLAAPCLGSIETATAVVVVVAQSAAARRRNLVVVELSSHEQHLGVVPPAVEDVANHRCR